MSIMKIGQVKQSVLPLVSSRNSIVHTHEKTQSLLHRVDYRKGLSCLYNAIICQEGYCSCCEIYQVK